MNEDSSAAVAAYPGYVRLVLPSGEAQARAACRKFSELCEHGRADRALILARSSRSDEAELHSQMALATRGVARGFKLAVVARGADAGAIRRLVEESAARRRASVKVFPSEHRAAAWLML